MEDWVSFFRERRIGFQVGLTRDARMKKEWERCLENTDGLRTLFEGVEVKPSILHGDLWSGNIASVGDRPCIFDPASLLAMNSPSPKAVDPMDELL